MIFKLQTEKHTFKSGDIPREPRTNDFLVLDDTVDGFVCLELFSQGAHPKNISHPAQLKHKLTGVHE